jgi:hypothetical protein
MDQVVKPKQALFLWRISWLCLVSSLYAYHLHLKDVSLSSFIVYCSSLLYWRRPRYNYIRTIDVSIAVTSIYYHLYKAFCNKYGYIYSMKLLVLILLYSYSWYLHYKKRYWLSIYAHGLVHLFGNLSNIQFYNHLYSLRKEVV